MHLVSSRIVPGVLAAFCVLLTSAMAEDPELGPIIGDVIPHELDSNGQPGFAEIVGENGMVLFFVRSINWCPYCQNQVINIAAQADEFESRGLALVFLSYDSIADQNKFKKRKQIASTFVSDKGSEIIDAFGLRNEHYPEGSFAYGVPHPAVFFIGPDKTVNSKLYEKEYSSDRKSYKNRPPVEVILAEADKLTAP